MKGSRMTLAWGHGVVVLVFLVVVSVPNAWAQTYPSSPTTSKPTPTPTATNTSAPTVAETTFAPTTTSPSPSVATTVPTVSSTNSTGAPTSSPSDAPTVGSLAPTESPTVSTNEPTTLPTDPGTDNPTPKPSPAPTQPGTDTPTESPPSPAPTSRPTLGPTRGSSPTVSPTLERQSSTVPVVMVLEDSAQLQDVSAGYWTTVTENHIRGEITRETVDDTSFTGLTVGTNITYQKFTGRRLRFLQASPLEIAFETTVTFQSDRDDYDVPDLVAGAFNTEEDRQSYINKLKQTGSFNNVVSMQVAVDGDPLVKPASEPDSPNYFLIVGASAGALALSVLVGLFIFRRREKKPVVVAQPAGPPRTTGERISTEILVDNQDDISTLGDPMYAPGGMLIPGLDKDETVAASIVSGDYDFVKAYGGDPSFATNDGSRRMMTVDGSSDRELSLTDSARFGLAHTGDSLFADDASFEEQFRTPEDQFEIVAPAGKLGMVIDTPNGGVPVVHAIKESSVLARQVKVGDRLISVDDEDTTGMTAMQVSKLISIKSDNPSRVLVFVRTRARAISTDT